MNYTGIVLAIIGMAAAFGATSVFFKRGQGEALVKQLQDNVAAFKDAEQQKNELIASLRAEILTKDRVIERLTNDGTSRKKSRK